jgi:hypothetical protein
MLSSAPFVKQDFARPQSNAGLDAGLLCKVLHVFLVSNYLVKRHLEESKETSALDIPHSGYSRSCCPPVFATA